MEGIYGLGNVTHQLCRQSHHESHLIAVKHKREQVNTHQHICLLTVMWHCIIFVHRRVKHVQVENWSPHGGRSPKGAHRDSSSSKSLVAGVGPYCVEL